MNSAHTSGILDSFDVRRLAEDALSETTADFLAQQLRTAVRIKQGPTTSNEDEQREQIRLRLITNALIAARLSNQQPPWLESLDELVQGAGLQEFVCPRPDQLGVTVLRVDGWVIIQLPTARSEGEVLQLLASLSQIEHQYSGADHWVIDLSGILLASTSLVAYLMGFQHGRSEGGASKMSLLWMRSETVPKVLLEATMKRFSLCKHGTFLLSQSASESESKIK